MDRREVFSARTLLKNVNVVHEELIKQTFLDDLRMTFASAKQNKESVVIVLVGHGEEGGSFVVGQRPGQGSKTRPMMLHRHELAVLLGLFPGVQATVILTSCFSGSWAEPVITPLWTSLTAAGALEPSESWCRSPSPAARMCGGIWSSGLALRFASDENLVRDDKTFKEWTDSFHNTMKWIDRFSWRHDIQFAAQNEAWLTEWKKLVNLPLDRFIARFHTLPVAQAPPAENTSLDRSGEVPSALKMAGQPILHMRGGSRGSLRGGFSEGERQTSLSITSESLKSSGDEGTTYRETLLRSAVERYFESRPGRPNAGPNVDLQNLGDRLLEGHSLSGDETSRLYEGVEYRNELTRLSEQYVNELLKNPKCLFAQFDDDMFIKTASNTVLKAALQKVASAGLFPVPHGEQGAQYTKPARYLVSMLLHESAEVNTFDSSISWCQQFFEKELELRRKIIQVRTSTTNLKGTNWQANFNNYLRDTLGPAIQRGVRAISPTRKGKRSSLASPPTSPRAKSSSISSMTNPMSPKSLESAMKRLSFGKGKGKGRADEQE